MNRSRGLEEIQIIPIKYWGKIAIDLLALDDACIRHCRPTLSKVRQDSIGKVQRMLSVVQTALIMGFMEEKLHQSKAL